MPSRTLIISDTHFADRVKSAGPVKRFAKLIEGYDQVIINGDGFELEPQNHKPLALEALSQLTDMCRANGTELVTLAGNHDPVDEWPRHIKLLDGRVLVSHGDAFHPGISPWCTVAKELKLAYAQALQAMFEAGHPDDLQTRLQAAHKANKQEWDREERPGGKLAKRTTILGLAMAPQKIYRLLHYWWTIPQLSSQFAQQYSPEAKVVIFGHTHHQGVWYRQGRWVINTGAYHFPGKPLACTINAGVLTVHKVRLVNDFYSLGPPTAKPLAKIDIASL